MPDEATAAAPETAPEAAATPAPVEEVVPSLTGLGDIMVEVTAVLGTTQLPIEQFLKLGRGAIVELQQAKDAPMTVLVNGYPFATGEIRVLGEKVGFAVNGLIDHSRDLE